ncbi:hypothetical protein PENTCL1PPCAC_26942 [Pristionchus entomophagus]|uniref:CUB domain-containing protein n=1 Tax=Pristionchus entomophagus TaxID=358040 RepID=A0AAV5UEH6_9BILA|nr:hypothetical protein PENTCL1PPCAC_26942 [Pristionchus entomophagus]
MAIRMILFIVLITLLSSHSVVTGDPCQCVGEDQRIDPTTNPILFFQHPTTTGQINGVPCSANCSFQAHLDFDDKQYSLQVQIINNNLLDGKITIDGMAKDETITFNTPTGVLVPTSYGDSITIKFVQPDGMKGEFMLAVKKVSGRPVAPPTRLTTLSPSTPPFDSKFTANPLLVANDIMIAFDLGSEYVEEYKKFAVGIIDQLSIRPKESEEDCGAGSRLTLIGLSSMDGFSNQYAPFWTTSADQAKGNINSIVRLSNGKFNINPLSEYLEGFGNESTNCENRGRIFILLASSLPKEYNSVEADNKAKILPFIDGGIHQITVNYKTKRDDLKYYADYNKTNIENEWNFFSLSGNADEDVKDFINNYLVDSSPESGAIHSFQKTVSIPPYYSGRRGEEGETRDYWETAKHYCNFQKTTDKDVPEGTPICLTVYYDLEADRDYVKIYSGDAKEPEKQELIVHLTGRDVSGTTFELPDALGSIVFSSDEKNVYDGFHAKIAKC